MPLPAPAPDRTALVTGASSGIGIDLARELAQRGHGLVLVARRQELLDEVAKEIRDRHGARVEVLPTDLADADARRELIDQIDVLGLTIDILVNNAGFSTLGPVHKSDADRELAMVRTNVEAVVHLCSLAVPEMAQRGRGAVLNVASTAAFQPLPGQPGYGASKSFVLSYTEAMSVELRKTGVTATALCPGPVETGFAEAAGTGGKDAIEALPDMMWLESAEVARVGIEALDAGRPVVIPGQVNRLVSVAGRLLPRRLLLPVIAWRHPSL